MVTFRDIKMKFGEIHKYTQAVPKLLIILQFIYLNMNLLLLILCFRTYRYYIHFIFFSTYFYQLEANYFTTFQWALSYIDMNQPWSYMYSPSRSPLPPPSSTQFLWVFPVHRAQALVSCIPPGLVICFTIDNIHAVLSKHPTLAFSHRVQKSVLYICVSCIGRQIVYH